jgi:hypothetical protein
VVNEMLALLRHPSEELLCRLGRLAKDEGDKVNPRTACPGGAPGSPAQADLYYAQALDFYDRAYKVRQGHFPGITKAALLHVRAALARDRGEDAEAHRRAAAALAQALLDGKDRWPAERPDDNIWHLAAEAEAHLLLGHWDEAARLYSRARREPNWQPWHGGGMRKQARRIRACFEVLGVTECGPFADLSALFGAEVP